MGSTLKPGSDPVFDILRAERQPLDVFFAPQTVAVIGATEKQGSVGRTILWNLITSPFGGTVYPVNPKRSNVLGIKAYPSVKELPEPPELAVIVTPAPTVPAIIGECVDKGVRAAIVISAGFKETGKAGVELEKQIMLQACRGNMRIIGPNCLGVMRPPNGFNATFAGKMALPGYVAFISQSGALATAILDWSIRESVGFSTFVSIGSMLDVGWGDLIDLLGNDPKTKSIVIYMESIGDARSFISAAREVALTKPIIVIKAGRTEGAAKAAASHTGSMTGSDEVLEAAFRRCGVLRVNRIEEVFDMAEVLAKQPRPEGPRLSILTNAGGPGVLAADSLLLNGGQLAEISKTTMEEFNKFLPSAWSHNNPIDVLGDAEPERYAKALEVAAKDPNTDGMLVILTPQAMTDPTQTAEKLKPYAQGLGKPVLASWMGGVEVAAGEEILNRAGIPTFLYPDAAARTFMYMWRLTYNLVALYQTPTLPSDDGDNNPDRAKAEMIIAGVRESKRTILTESESKQLLMAYRIQTVETHIAVTEEEAVQKAEEMGFPVVLKLHSETITHKTDVGGVKLNLTDAAAVKKAFKDIKTSVTEKGSGNDFLGVTVQPMVKPDGYELILGSSLDPQFGPVLLFGSGGQLVEVFKDRSLSLPPLNTTLARRLMERTKIFTALNGVRGRPPCDILALEQLLVRFSQLVVEQRWIKEIDINPLIVSHDRLISLDARVVLHEPGTKETEIPKLAIRPYPQQYVSITKMKDGTPITIRPIRHEDEPLMVKFHESLSEQSVHLRYFNLIALGQRVAHERLTRICFEDFDREMALVIEHKGTILGVGRLSRISGKNEARFSILISDRYQRQGLGTELMRQLLHVGKEENLNRITANVLPENTGMLAVCKKLGFELKHDEVENIVVAAIKL